MGTQSANVIDFRPQPGPRIAADGSVEFDATSDSDFRAIRYWIHRNRGLDQIEAGLAADLEVASRDLRAANRGQVAA